MLRTTPPTNEFSSPSSVWIGVRTPAPCSLSRRITWDKTLVFRALVFAAVCALGPLLRADDAIDRLVRLVGSDAGFCMEIPRLDETVTAFEQGPFFSRLQKSQIYATWKQSVDHQHVAKISAAIENFSGKPVRQFAREIFGTAVVVAAYPGPGPEVSGILLTEAASREILEAELKKWNHAEALSTEEIKFEGGTYYKRICAIKQETVFYSTVDRTFLLSDHEELIRRALTLASSKDSSGSLLAAPAYLQARQSLSARDAAKAYVNPRAWDALLGLTKSSSNETHRSAISSALVGFWRRCEWLAIGLQTDRGIVLEATAHYSMSKLSDQWKQFFQAMDGSAEFLRLVPANALCVLAGRQAFGDLLRRSLPADCKDVEPRAWDSFRQVSRGLLLGMDLIDDVLPAFRENWGGYLVPRKDAKPDELPVDGLLAVELPAGERTATAPRNLPPFRDSLDNGLNTGLNFVAAYFNMSASGKAAVVRTEFDKQKNTRVRWIESLGPYEPAYGLTTNYLVLATSPRAVRDFATTEATSPKSTAKPAQSALAHLQQAYFPTENQVLFVDTQAIRGFLKEHGQQLIEQAARVRSTTPADIDKTLARFLDVTNLFDSVFVAGRLGQGTARLIVGGVVDPQSAAAAVSSAESPARPK